MPEYANTHNGIKATIISNKIRNDLYEKYPYKFEFIRKGEKIVRVRYWNRDNLGRGRDVTRKEAIWLYKKLIKEGYKLVTKN